MELFRLNVGKAVGTTVQRQERCFVDISENRGANQAFPVEYGIGLQRYAPDGKSYVSILSYPSMADHWTTVASENKVEYHCENLQIYVTFHYDPQTLRLTDVSFPGTNERCVLTSH